MNILPVNLFNRAESEYNVSRLTKKELLEGGWIDQYILGLTTESESRDIERLAHLYPDVQEAINSARGRLCSSFNRGLTRPALRYAFLTRRNVLVAFVLVISVSLGTIAFLSRKHFSLWRDYRAQVDSLALARSQNLALTEETRHAVELSKFVNAENTKRIQLRGCEDVPDAEVVVYKCVLTGKMMLRVIELPRPPRDGYFDIWAHSAAGDKRIGQLKPPIRYDSLYVLETAPVATSLVITAMDPVTGHSQPVCLHALTAH